MTFFNTHWTWQYFLMLFFVFWTLLLLSNKHGGAWAKPTWEATAFRLTWAALGTYVFHCIW